MGTSRSPRPASFRGFTLVEMLVAIVILSILVVVLFELTAGVGNVFKSSGGKISAYQNARAAFSTLSETLARATLNTYSDYVNVTGTTTTFRNPTNATTFVPTQFMRASELHFLCGPTVDIPNASQTSAATGAATADANPGDAVYFQAPLGVTTPAAAGSTPVPGADYRTLNRAINSVGFYVQYGKPDTSLVPSWLSGIASVNNYRFRLVEYVEPTENLQIYNSTSSGSYLLDWMKFAGPPPVRVLAEDIVLLVLRPRLSPSDEAVVAGTSYNETTQFGSILSPNYHYDSRAWQTGYPAGQRVNANSNALQLAKLMANQLPPIVDIAMVCVDSLSLARFPTTTNTPPAPLKIPGGMLPGGMFTDSSKLETDLATYATQLSANNIRFHIQRAAIEIQGAKWSNALPSPSP